MGGVARPGSPDEAELFPGVNFLENKTGVFVFELSNVLPKTLQRTALLNPVEGGAGLPDVPSPPRDTLYFLCHTPTTADPGSQKLPGRMVLPPTPASGTHYCTAFSKE